LSLGFNSRIEEQLRKRGHFLSYSFPEKALKNGQHNLRNLLEWGFKCKNRRELNQIFPEALVL